MTSQSKSICLISNGLSEKNLRLQPWRYLHETAHQLARLGYSVTLVSDGATRKPIQATLKGVDIERLSVVSEPAWGKNKPLRQTIGRIKPDIILLHVGLTSFLYQQLDRWQDIPSVGIFTSPMYSPAELLRLGLPKLARGYRLSAVHVIGTFLPKLRLRRAMRKGSLRQLVVQSAATGQRLIECGLRQDQIYTIPPGVDGIWNTRLDGGSTRARLGYRSQDIVILYFGSPAQLRGLHTLIRAVELAGQTNPSIKLLVLSRRRTDELITEDTELGKLLSRSVVGSQVKVVNGYLDEHALVEHVAACDIVALPFELVPSDAPLSLLEAQALGKPVVTTAVGCLPELVAQGTGYIAEPADAVSLACKLRQAAQELIGRPQPDMHIQTRSWNQVGAEWSQLIQSL
ncbi:MAG: glycosyltransferase family 4 protein [Kouleothrix sp.]|nr:glycosyltransferase family 4 protein [Kouleothrix sp.]